MRSGALWRPTSDSPAIGALPRRPASGLVGPASIPSDDPSQGPAPALAWMRPQNLPRIDRIATSAPTRKPRKHGVLRDSWLSDRGLLSALARKFGDVFGRRTRSLLAASRRPSGAETERCWSSDAGVSVSGVETPPFVRKRQSVPKRAVVSSTAPERRGTRSRRSSDALDALGAPPPRTTSSSSLPRAQPTTAITYAAPMQRAISAGACRSSRSTLAGHHRMSRRLGAPGARETLP
jgi:hypothetical protein